MALQKIKTLSNGVSFDYHKISALNFIDWESVMIKIDGYLNHEARLSGKTPIETSVVYVPFVDKTNVFGSAYVAICASNKKTTDKITTPEVTEEVAEAVNAEGVTIPAFTKIITPAVYEEIETNFFTDSVAI